MTISLDAVGENPRRGKSVFISHASKNFKIADEIRALLEEQRVSCWIAPRDIPPGAQYGAAIVEAIRDCSLVVLLLTEEANQSKPVENEIERAFNNSKVVVPIRLRDIKPSTQLEFFISNAQWVDAFVSPLKGRIGEIVSLVQTIEMGRPPAPPAPEKKTLGGTVELYLERALRHKMLTAASAFVVLAGISLATLGLQAKTHADLGAATGAISVSAQRIDSAASSLAGTGAAVTAMSGKLDRVKQETSSDPRKELNNRGVLWQPANFYSAIRAADVPTVSLFLQGGMPVDITALGNAYQASNDATRELLLKEVNVWPEGGCNQLVGTSRVASVMSASPGQKALFKRVCDNPDGRKQVADRVALSKQSLANAQMAYQNDLKSRTPVSQCAQEYLTPRGLQMLYQSAPSLARADDMGQRGPSEIMYATVLDAMNDTNEQRSLAKIKAAVVNYCTILANEKPNIDISDDNVRMWETLNSWLQ